MQATALLEAGGIGVIVACAVMDLLGFHPRRIVAVGAILIVVAKVLEWWWP